MSETLIPWPVGVPLGSHTGYGYTPTDTRTITSMASGAPKIRDTGVVESAQITMTLQLTAAELDAFNTWRRVSLARGTGWISMPIRTSAGLISVPALIMKIGKVTLSGTRWKIALTLFTPQEL